MHCFNNIEHKVFSITIPRIQCFNNNIPHYLERLDSGKFSFSRCPILRILRQKTAQAKLLRATGTDKILCSLDSYQNVIQVFYFDRHTLSWKIIVCIIPSSPLLLDTNCYNRSKGFARAVCSLFCFQILWVLLKYWTHALPATAKTRGLVSQCSRVFVKHQVR